MPSRFDVPGPSRVPMPRWMHSEQVASQKAKSGFSNGGVNAQLQEGLVVLLKFYLDASMTPSPLTETCALSLTENGMNNDIFQVEQWKSLDMSGGPKGSQLQKARDIAAVGGGLSGYTTVMIQQIPFRYTQDKLLAEINKSGFEGMFDFLFLPEDAKSHSNRGFGFVNFLSPIFAEKFYQRYQGQRLMEYEVDNPLSVKPADVQGFEQSAACFFASWRLRRRKRNACLPVFLKPVPAHVCDVAHTEKPRLISDPFKKKQ